MEPRASNFSVCIQGDWHLSAPLAITPIPRAHLLLWEDRFLASLSPSSPLPESFPLNLSKPSWHFMVPEDFVENTVTFPSLQFTVLIALVNGCVICHLRVSEPPPPQLGHKYHEIRSHDYSHST